jgi:DNA-binding SARP family transcriptional activator
MSRAPALTWRLPRAVAGLAVTALLLVGVPWGLARIAGSPLPPNWPGWQQVRGFFASPLTDDAIIRALADAAWLLWAVFAVALIVEVTAVIRGRPAPRLPAIAPVQALAAALVGASMMTALHAPRTAPRAAQPLHAALTSATSIAAPLLPGQPAKPDTAATTAAVRAAGRDSTPASRPRVYRVREGDDLWAIADRFLGDGEDWHDLYELNEGRPQPDGRSLTDPNLILPGWVLLIPQPGPGTAAASHPHSAHPASSGTRSPGDGHSAVPSAQPSRSAVPSARPSASASPDGGPSHAAHAGRVAVSLPTGALIGISVAIMVAAALTLAAIQRRRQYRPRPGPPSSLAPAAPPLPEVISALRRAARTAPPAAGLGTGDDTDADPYLDLYETSAEPGAEGDEAASSAAEPASEPKPEPERSAQAERAPGTIPLGIDRDDGEVAVNLAMLGGLGLTGPGADSAARAILASLLAQAPPGEAWLPAAVIPAAEAAWLLPGTGSAAIPGVSVPATLGAALDEMESLLLTMARTGDADEDAADGELAAGAVAGSGIVLIASASQGPRRRLAGILEAGRDAGVAAVLLGASPDGVTCEVAADGTVVTVTPPDPVLDGIRLFTLGPAEAAAIAGVLQEASGSVTPDRPYAFASADGSQQLLQTPSATAPDQRVAASRTRLPARAAAPPPAPPASPGPAGRTEAGKPPAPGDQAVRLSLLGPLRITAGGQEVSGGLRKARELLAYLAVHPDGASGEAIAEALWPEADPARAAGQRNLALRKARDMLRAATGLTTPMWILNASGRYRLDPALIATDLQAFGDALEEARQTEGQERLAACRKAVALYRGELADGEAYEWAEPFAETARRRALDAWTTIAEILQPASPDEALSALETALTHDPYNEYLYQRIMRLQAAAGRPEAVRRTLGLLETRLAELDITPSSRTRQAAASLLSAAAKGGWTGGSGDQ